MAAVVIMFFLFAFSASGSETRSGDIVEVAQTESIGGDLIVICKTLKMDGEVKEDLLAGGIYLIVGNTVSNDIAAGGYDIKIQANVGDDVRVAGANVEIDGDIKGDLVAFGGNVNILGNVAGDVITGGGNVKILGNIQGTLDARCGKMVIEGTIGQDANLTVSELILSSDAMLNGNLTYASKRSADIAEGAHIEGNLTRESAAFRASFWKFVSSAANHLPQNPERWTEWRKQLPAWFKTLLRLSSFLSLLAAGVIILYVWRRHATMAADRIMSFPFRCFGIGLAFLIAVPICAFLLCISIIGIHIGLVVLAVYMVIFYVSRLYVALAIGREIMDRITKHEVRMIWPMILGLFIITLLSSIPFYIGWIVKLICTSFGLGGMLMARKRCT